MALLLGAAVLMLPSPEGTKFKVAGDSDRLFFQTISDRFTLLPNTGTKADSYIIKTKETENSKFSGSFLKEKAGKYQDTDIQVDYVDGLSPKAKRFLAVLAVLIFLFMVEPIPLEITAILIGVLLVVMQVVDVKTAWP